MYEALIQSLSDIKLYIGSGYLAGLYLLCLVYLLITEKEKRLRVLLVYSPLTVLAVFIFPLSRMVFTGFGLDAETYYRLLWLLPMGVTIAYAACKLFAAHRRIGLALTAAAVALCGTYVYANPNITKAENAYHIPSVTAHICDFLQEAEELDYIRAAFPAGLVHFVRQYDSDIMMPFGRDMTVPRWDYFNAVYEAMEKPETGVIDVEELLEATRAAECNYIILPATSLLSVDPVTEYELVLLATIDGFRVYKDPVMAGHIKEKYGPYL